MTSVGRFLFGFGYPLDVCWRRDDFNGAWLRTQFGPFFMLEYPKGETHE